MNTPSTLLPLLPFFSAVSLLATEPVFQPEIIDPDIQIGYGLAIADVNGDGNDDILLADKSDVVWYENPSWTRHVLASKLTYPKDNVCLAARDLDGDGLCEIAVGARWNPGETSNATESGAVFYLVPPEDRTQRWTAIALPHEPTVHRMHWKRRTANRWELVVQPLHGRGNKNGQGAGAKVIGYEWPKDPTDPANWNMRVIDESLRKSHNFDVAFRAQGTEAMVLAGAEGLLLDNGRGAPVLRVDGAHFPEHAGAGEVRFGPSYTFRGSSLEHYAAIEPMHGNQVVVYSALDELPSEDETGEPYTMVWDRTVIDDSLNQGHALACANLLNLDREQIVAGWRQPNAEGKVGIKLYIWRAAEETWKAHWIDDNQMATEDLKVADLNADGKLDLIAAGRATKNLKVYWNHSELGEKPQLAGGWVKHEIWRETNCATAVAADVNGDGHQDVMLSAGPEDRLLLGPDWQQVSLFQRGSGMRPCIHAETMDVDGDGDMDFVGAARHVYWLENPGGEAAEKGDWTYRVVDDQISGVHCVLRADVNQDGIDDLIANEFNPKGPFASSLTWQEVPSSKDATWTRHVFAKGDAPGGNHYMGMGDLDGDGDQDIACGAKGKPFANGNWFAWWENTGEEVWKKHLLADHQIGATCILPADLNGDGKVDMMASRGHGTGILWFENLGDKKFELREVDPLLAGPHCLTVSDLDGDGDIDAATTAKDDSRTVWYENDGEGNFTIHDIDDNQAAYDIRSVDMDGDGDLDLLVAGQRSQNVVWYENQLK